MCIIIYIYIKCFLLAGGFVEFSHPSHPKWLSSPGLVKTILICSSSMAAKVHEWQPVLHENTYETYDMIALWRPLLNLKCMLIDSNRSKNQQVTVEEFGKYGRVSLMPIYLLQIHHNSQMPMCNNVYLLMSWAFIQTPVLLQSYNRWRFFLHHLHLDNSFFFRCSGISSGFSTFSTCGIFLYRYDIDW